MSDRPCSVCGDAATWYVALARTFDLTFFCGGHASVDARSQPFSAESALPGYCAHESLGEGPRLPLNYGTAPTEVCKSCGAWRDARNVGEHHRRSGLGFRPPAELLIKIARGHED